MIVMTVALTALYLAVTAVHHVRACPPGQLKRKAQTAEAYSKAGKYLQEEDEYNKKRAYKK